MSRKNKEAEQTETSTEVEGGTETETETVVEETKWTIKSIKSEEYGNIVMVEEPETKNIIPRATYIRNRVFGDGATRGMVSKELDVPYQIVYAAIKGDAKAKWEKVTGKKALGTGKAPTTAE